MVEQVADETLVYDLDRHRAHCLSATAAWIWRRCDGVADVATLAGRLGRQLGRDADEEVVWVALHRLSRAHLLEGPLPPARARSLHSRRELVAKVAVFGISVLSIAAPAAGQAATCIMRAACESMQNTNPRCAGQPCCDVPGRFCKSQGCGQNCCCHS